MQTNRIFRYTFPDSLMYCAYNLFLLECQYTVLHLNLWWPKHNYKHINHALVASGNERNKMHCRWTVHTYVHKKYLIIVIIILI